MSQPIRMIYMDVCALCRPFDDQTRMRIRLETDAIQLILSYVHSGSLALIVSPMHDVEIDATTDVIEREHLLSMLRGIGTRYEYNLANARQRAERLTQSGIGAADAAHLVFAEEAKADFITCDDRLIRQCRRIQPSVWFGTPVAFCNERGLL